MLRTMGPAAACRHGRCALGSSLMVLVVVLSVMSGALAVRERVLLSQGQDGCGNSCGGCPTRPACENAGERARQNNVANPCQWISTGSGPRDGYCTGTCFPAHATLEVLCRGAVHMEDVRVGDQVLGVDWASAQPVYRPVYFIGHADPITRMDFVTLTTSNGATVQLSAGHYMRVCTKNCNAADLTNGVLPVMEARPAGSVRVGDRVYAIERPGSAERSSALLPDPLQGGLLAAALQEVVAISAANERGLFAPIVRSMDLVVDGIASNPYAQWAPLEAITDILGPAHIPTVYEALGGTPFYVIYKLFGAKATSTVVGWFLGQADGQGVQPLNLGVYYAAVALTLSPVVLGMAAAVRAVLGAGSSAIVTGRKRKCGKWE